MNTTELHSQALESFVHCFNICYPDWKVHGDSEQQLEPRHVDFDMTLTSTWGRCGPRSGGHVFYRLNPDWWVERKPGDRLGLTIHELAHVKDTSHQQSFWEHVIDNYHALAAEKEAISGALGFDIDWETVREFLVTDPSNSKVDNRQEVALERRRKIAEAIGYSGRVEPFRKMSMYTRSYRHRDGYVNVDIDNLEYEKRTLDELVEFFHQRQRPGVSYEKNSYVIEPPVAREIDDGYEVVEGHTRTSLAVRGIIDRCATRTSLDVELVDAA